jgi:hypothetical protein
MEARSIESPNFPVKADELFRKNEAQVEKIFLV